MENAIQVRQETEAESEVQRIMKDRLDIALAMAIKMVNDKKTKKILSCVRELGDCLAVGDWNDFVELRESGELEQMIRNYFID